MHAFEPGEYEQRPGRPTGGEGTLGPRAGTAGRCSGEAFIFTASGAEPLAATVHRGRFVQD